MASQVAHIIYAQKYFEKFPAMAEKFDRFEFFLGCLFPDIRRIDHNISRQDTHLCFPKVDLDFENLSAFSAGWKYHIYCDMRREEILNRHDFYKLRHATDLYNLPAKIFEDEVVYKKFTGWDDIIPYFNNVPKVAGLKVSPESFALWYAILAKYFECQPDEKTTRIFISKLPGIAKLSDEITESIRHLRHNKRVSDILENVAGEIL